MRPTRKTYLKVSEVISCLQEYKQKHGDLPICIGLPGLARQPIISGIRYLKSKSSARQIIQIIPKYDVKGSANELASLNSLTRELRDIKRLFVNFANLTLKSKTLLEEFKRKAEQGRGYSCIITEVKEAFKKLYTKAQQLQEVMKGLSEFDQRLALVIREPFRDSDYEATFDHHIEDSLTDGEFAKLMTTGVGEKNSIRRLSIYKDVIQKLNTEINKRKRRVAMLQERIESELDSSEGMNAKILKKKAEGIVQTLFKRREYVLEKYMALAQSIRENIAVLEDDIREMISSVHAES